MSISRSATYNLGGAIVPVIVTLVTVPLYLDVVGEERYGVLAIAWLMLGYMGLLDLGLGAATAQAMSRLRDSASTEREQLFWTALFLNILLGLVAATLLYGGGWFILTQFDLIEVTFLQEELLRGLPWLALSLPVTMSVSMLHGTLQARERFFVLNGVQSLGAVFLQVLPLVVAILVSPSVDLLILAALIGRLLTGLLLFVYCWRYVPLRTKLVVAPKLVRELFVFGGWVTLIAMSRSVLTTADRLLIGAITGAASVAYYVIPMNLVTRLRIIPISLSGALFPRFALTSASKDEGLPTAGVLAIASIMTPTITICIFAIEPFIALWIDPSFAGISSLVGEIVLLGLLFNSLAIVPHTYLIASGRPKVPALILLFQMLPYLLLLIVFIHYWQIVGAAVAWTIRVVLDAGIQYWRAGLPVRPLAQVGTLAFIVVGALISVILLPYHLAERWIAAFLFINLSLYMSWRFAPIQIRAYLESTIRILKTKLVRWPA